MVKSFLERRHEDPDYEVAMHITGVRCLEGKVHWHIESEGHADGQELTKELLAEVLDRSAKVLRDGPDEN